jgi:hypothetical protein
MSRDLHHRPSEKVTPGAGRPGREPLHGSGNVTKSILQQKQNGWPSGSSMTHAFAWGWIPARAVERRAVGLHRKELRIGIGHPGDTQSCVQFAEGTGQAIKVDPSRRTTQSASSVGRSAE